MTVHCNKMAVSVYGVLLALSSINVGACRRDNEANDATAGKARGALSFPVEVMDVKPRPLDYSLQAPGTIEAFETVQVTARVAGVVERVGFKEGDRVKAGQSLVTIEPQRYNLAVAAARAALEKSHAGVADAEAGVARREAAVAQSPGLIPGEEVATWRTRVRTASAEVAAAEAALAQAELNLRDAFVRAPVAGIIESRAVQTGQYVQPGNVMATLVRRDPLLLRFSISAGDAHEVRPGMTVLFNIRSESRSFSARITHVSEMADQASRMVAITAQIVKPDPALRPGGFAEVVVPLKDQGALPAVPEIAIRPSERGFVAFVVEAGRAHERILELGLRTPDGLVAVKQGLREGDQVVVRGAEALADGVAVRVEKQRATPPATASSDGKPPA